MNTHLHVEALLATMHPITNIELVTEPDYELATDIAMLWLDAVSADITEETTNKFAGAVGSMSSFVARNALGEMVTAASWKVNDRSGIAHLELLATREAEREQGIGRVVVRTAERFFRDLGIDMFTVTPVCDSDGFYEDLYYKRQPSGLYRKNVGVLSRTAK